MVGGVDAGGIVDGVGIDASAIAGEGDAPFLGDSEIGALPDRKRAQLLGVDAQAVIGLVADIGVRFAARLDVGADAAEPKQLALALEQSAHQLGGRDLRLVEPGESQDFRREVYGLEAAREHAAALGDQLLVVIGPRGARRIEQALALFPRGLAIAWIWVDENVAVIEGGEQANFAREQHAVAEHVAGHVANADDSKFLLLDILADFTEVAFDRFPRALGGDAHGFVVVADRAAARERIAKPVAVFGGDAVGDVGKSGRTFVGGDDEVSIVLIPAHHIGGRLNAVADDIVGDV